MHGDASSSSATSSTRSRLGEYAHKAVGSDDLFAAAYDKDGAVAVAVDARRHRLATARTPSPRRPTAAGSSAARTRDSITIGSTTLKSKGKTDALLIKLAADGDLEWVKSFGGRYDDTIMQVAVDGNGNIYVAGHFADISDWGGTPLKAHGGSDNDIVLAKYDVNGDHVWSQNFGNVFNDVAGGLSVDPAGNITIVGSFENKGTISFGDGDDHTLARRGRRVRRAVHDRRQARVGAHVRRRARRRRVGRRVGRRRQHRDDRLVRGHRRFRQGRGRRARATRTCSRSSSTRRATSCGSRRGATTITTRRAAVALDDKGNAVVVGAFGSSSSSSDPPIEGKRPENDPVLSKAPKPDVAVVKLDAVITSITGNGSLRTAFLARSGLSGVGGGVKDGVRLPTLKEN